MVLQLDGNRTVDQPDDRRENFVPLHSTDLIDYLAQHAALQPPQQVQFRRLCALILSLLHHLHRQQHQQISYVYAPLDPDRDRVLRTVPTAEYRNQLAGELFDRVHTVLDRANYHRLTPEDIQQSIQAASQWGVRMRANFKLLKHLEVYGRGYLIGHRKYRDWRRLFRQVSVEVPLYQRLVVLFRTSDDLASDQFDSQSVYLRMFKNVPRQDIDMMLPATGIQMSWLDHSKIVVPSVYAAGIALWRFLRNVFLLALFGVFKTIGLIVLAIFAIGFGLKSMFSYRTNTRRRYMLNMAQSLYYQNLDNNAGVLYRLLEDGEQQAGCEAILAYFVSAIGEDCRELSLQEIDQACEQLLLQLTGYRVDFNVEHTARSLVQLGVLTVTRDGWQAHPLDEALQKLDATWDDRFG